jgi:hypothetical protein
MAQTYCRKALGQASEALLIFTLFCATALAQQPARTFLNVDAVEPLPMMNSPLPESPAPHRFLDTTNRTLFATAAGFCAADFAVTRANLNNGGVELNPVTRIFSGSTAGLAVNFVGETAGVIGVSYFFHRTGHHKLERITPLVNIGASAFAVAYGLTHR